MTSDWNVWELFMAKHLVLVLVVLGLGLMFRRFSAAFRHSFLLIGFVWIAALPVLILGIPSWIIPREKPIYSTAISTSGGFKQAPTSVKTVMSPSRGERVIAEATPTPASEIPVRRHRFPTNILISILVAVYLAGVGLGLFRILRTLVVLRQWFRTTRPVPESVLGDLDAAVRAVGLRKTPRLVINETVQVPMTFGAICPVVVVPKGGASRTALLHECAHVRRSDWLALLFARFVCVLFWFDPLLLVLERNLRASSEAATDDIVVLCGVAPTEYANELVGLATMFIERRFQASLAMVGNSDLKSRVSQILGRARRELKLPVHSAVFTMFAACLTVIPFAAVAWSSVPIAASRDGFVDLGNGGWARVFAISEMRGNQVVSWNMRGELLPCAIGPTKFWMDNPPTDDKGQKQPRPTQFLVLQTSVNDSTGISIGEDRTTKNSFNMGTQLYPNDGLPGIPQPLGGGLLTVFPVKFPARGDFSVYVTAPTESEWNKVAVATYDRGRFIKTSDPGFYPHNLNPDAGGQIHFAIPKTVRGQARVNLIGSKSGAVENVDVPTKGDVAISYLPEYMGLIQRVVLENRPPLKTALISGIPTRPEPSKESHGIAFPRVEVRTCADDRYRFGNEFEIKLDSIGLARGKSMVSWTPQGVPIGTHEVKADDASGVAKRKFFLTARQLTPVREERPAFFTNPSIALYDGCGFPMISLNGIYNDHVGVSFVDRTPVATKSQDLFVRVGDWTRSSKRRYPITEVVSDWTLTKEVQRIIYPDHRKMSALGGNVLPMLAPAFNELNQQTVLNLFDGSGNPCPTYGYSFDGTKCEFLLADKLASKVKTIEVTTVPYMYLRFPNVAMSPNSR